MTGIVKRFQKGLPVNHINQNTPSYPDLGEPSDLHQSLIEARRVTERFESLSNDIRSQFNNDPMLWLEAQMDNSKGSSGEPGAPSGDSSAAAPSGDSAEPGASEPDPGSSPPPE